MSSRTYAPVHRPLLILACAVPTVFGASAKKDDKLEGPIIGIDLGTTYSCVGIFKKGRVEIIPNDQGNRITPSYVAFAEDSGERLVGEAAKNQAAENPTQSVFDVKRLIGRRFKEESVQSDMKLLPYKIVPRGGQPVISVQVGGKERKLAPEEISAMVLGKMRETAENYLGEKVKNAVITVPAYFNDAQRSATKDAGAIAGLHVARIVNEPTAAALAYGLDKKGEQKIIIFDLGGGTFDVSLLLIDNGMFEVQATSGDTHLGGEDFDQRVMQHFIKEFKRKHGKDFSGDRRALQKLRHEVEKAKRGLSSTHQVRIEVEALYSGIDFSEELTRAKFENLNNDLFQKTLDPVKQVLKDAGLSKKSIDEVVLVGGSTRIPKVRKLLSDFFGGKELSEGINPDEAVAYGAAVQAGILAGDEGIGQELLLVDVIPLSIGIENEDGSLDRYFDRNTPIPCTKTHDDTTVENNQETITFNIYEGERPMAKDNHKLGSFDLTGIAPAKAGVPQIQTTVSIDQNGILTVKAKDEGTGRTAQVTITNDKGRLSEAQIEKMIKESEKFKEHDALQRERLDARDSFKQYLFSVQDQLDGNFGKGLDDEERQQVKDAIKDGFGFLSKNEDANPDEVHSKQKEVEEICSPLVSRAYGGSDDDDEQRENDEL